MVVDSLYKRNKNGRYERIGARYDTHCLPDGLHLIYVKNNQIGRSSVTATDISLDEVWKRCPQLVSQNELTDIVYKAAELYPAQKLTEEERQQWEAFKKTKAGKKLSKGMFRKSAAEIARTILEEMIR